MTDLAFVARKVVNSCPDVEVRSTGMVNDRGMFMLRLPPNASLLRSVVDGDHKYLYMGYWSEGKPMILFVHQTPSEEVRITCYPLEEEG